MAVVLVVPRSACVAVMIIIVVVAIPVRLICAEDKSDRLLAELALHELDVILTDAPASPTEVYAKVAFEALRGVARCWPGQGRAR
jgi:hypothetical protein